MIQNYVAVDLETTGLQPKEDRIIEIGALRVRDGEIVDTLSLLIHPGMKLSEKVTEITGITDQTLENAPRMEECVSQIFDFLGDDILLGQRILFDYSFLKKVAVNHNMKYEREGMDTLKIARKYLQNLESRTLSSLCEHYQIPIIAHRALEDARATHTLYQRLTQQFEVGEAGEKDIVFKPQRLIYQVKKEGPITKAQTEHLQRLMERHHIDLLQDIHEMTKNEASRKIDKILAEFGR